MPRLSQFVTRSVFFVYGDDPTTGQKGPRGSGVIVGLERTKGLPIIHHYYAVTCQHVLLGFGHDIRINSRNGGSRDIAFEPSDWQGSHRGDDLAAIDITDQIDMMHDDISALPLALLLTEEFMSAVELGIGEDGFLAGLFEGLPGKKRNKVAGRFGNLSLLADQAEPIKQGNGILRASHLFDLRSRPGFSGSPVFIYRTPDGDLRDIAYGPDFPRTTVRPEEHRANMFIRLLGIHSGQYRDTVVANETAANGSVVEKRLTIPNSTAVIVPSWEIARFLIEHPALAQQRHARERR